MALHSTKTLAHGPGPLGLMVFAEHKKSLRKISVVESRASITIHTGTR